MIKSLFTNSDYNKRFLKILKIKNLEMIKKGIKFTMMLKNTKIKK